MYYLSAEFLMGRSLLNTIYNLGLGGEYGKALTQMGYKMEEVADQEHNAGTGGRWGWLCWLVKQPYCETPCCRTQLNLGGEAGMQT